MALNSYRQFLTTRIPANNGAWTPISIPAGAIDATISLEDGTASFRVTADNTFLFTEGVFIAASGYYTFPGVCAQPVIVYVNPSVNTVAVLQIQS
jgi:hypothetical protein